MIMLLCLALLAAVVWYCLGGEGWKKTPQGTLVFHKSQQSVSPARFMGFERKTEWIPLPLPEKLPEAIPCAVQDLVLPCVEVSA